MAIYGDGKHNQGIIASTKRKTKHSNEPTPLQFRKVTKKIASALSTAEHLYKESMTTTNQLRGEVLRIRKELSSYISQNS
jgi:hypothetical protein